MLIESHYIINRVRQGRVGEEGFLQRGTEGRAAGAVPGIFKMEFEIISESNPSCHEYIIFHSTTLQVMFYDDEQKCVVVSKAVVAGAAASSTSDLKARAVSRTFPGGEKGRRGAIRCPTHQ